MSILIGIDIGSIALKIAALEDRTVKGTLKKVEGGAFHFHRLTAASKGGVLLSDYRRIRGNPLRSACELLEDLMKRFPSGTEIFISSTGLVGKTLSEVLEIEYESEFRALVRGIEVMAPQVNTVFEMGGEVARYMLLDKDPQAGYFGLADYQTNDDCAAGTGSFLDQQARRLRFEVEKIGDIVTGATRAARIAGRCSVFAKSDMIHAQQKGYKPDEVLRGLSMAVARNFKGNVVRGKPVLTPVAFVGGVSKNSAVVREIAVAFSLSEDEMIIPDFAEWSHAIGAALLAKRSGNRELKIGALDRIGNESSSKPFPSHAPLVLDDVVLLREQVKPYSFPSGKIGSISESMSDRSARTSLLSMRGVMLSTKFTRGRTGAPLKWSLGA